MKKCRAASHFAESHTGRDIKCIPEGTLAVYVLSAITRVKVLTTCKMSEHNESLNGVTDSET